MYKTMLKGMKSSHGNCKWKLGKWKKVKGEVELCENGFHCSERLIDAMMYVNPEVVTEVEVSGDHQEQNDKQVWSEMRVVRVWEWTKEDSVALSIYSAELCLEKFESVFPDDDRPRKAIEAAKKWLKNPTKENQEAARSARSAAWSARSAARSAWSAARSARSAAWSAAWSARSAARSAAWSAESAAWSARSAAWSARSAARSAAESAAKEEILDKINKWCIKRLKKCKEIK